MSEKETDRAQAAIERMRIRNATLPAPPEPETPVMPPRTATRKTPRKRHSQSEHIVSKREPRRLNEEITEERTQENFPGPLHSKAS